MRRSSFRILRGSLTSVFKQALTLSLVLIAISATRSAAYETVNDSSKYVPGKVEATPKYKQRLNKRINRWQNIMPNIFTLQFAGDIGMLSAGVGWDYGKSSQWETHVLIGYLPHRHRYQHYWTLTLREMYNPWSIKAWQSVAISPLSVSVSLNSILHGDFWTSEPERYPKGYYGFSSRVRFHLGLGQRFTYHIPERKRYLHSKISLYYEVSTCDLYVRQKWLNSSIPLKDIITLGIGMIYTL